MDRPAREPDGVHPAEAGGICRGVALSIVIVAEIWKLMLGRLPPELAPPNQILELRPEPRADGMATGSAHPTNGHRPPSLLDALIPVVALLVLIALTIVLFGRLHGWISPGRSADRRPNRRPGGVEERDHDGRSP